MTLDAETIKAIATEVARQLREDLSLPPTPVGSNGLTPLEEFRIRQMARERKPKKARP